MKILFYRCFLCKYCRRHSRNQFEMVYQKRAKKSQVRQLIKQNKIDVLPEKISMSYFG